MSDYDTAFLGKTSAPPANIGAGDNGNPPISFEFVSVHDPELRGSNRFNQYHAYKVTCVPHVADNVYRRYSDFVWLSDTLAAMYPGMFIPPLPPKKTFGSKSEEFIIAQRRPALERFLNRILRIPILAESAPFQMFVSRTHTFEDGQSLIKKELANRTSPVPLAAYQYYYPDALAQPLPPNVEADVSAMVNFLKEEETRLAATAENAASLAKLISQKGQLLNSFSTAIQQLYATEREYPNLPPVNRTDVIDIFAQWHVDHKERDVAFAHNFQQQFANEYDDVKVMQGLLKERENAAAKYEKSKVKSSKWALPTTKCDTEKLRSQREVELKAEEEDNLLLDTMTKLILFVQFKWMWEQRVAEYNMNMNQFAENQTAYAQRLYQNFDSVDKRE